MGWFNHELDKPLWASLLSNQFSRLKCSLGIVTQNSWGCFLVGFVYQVQHDTSHENQKNEAALPWNNMPVLKYWSISRLQNVIYRHRSNGVIDLESRPFTFNITSELVKGKKETSTNPLPLIAKGMGLLIYLLFFILYYRSRKHSRTSEKSKVMFVHLLQPLGSTHTTSFAKAYLFILLMEILGY